MTTAWALGNSVWLSAVDTIGPGTDDQGRYDGYVENVPMFFTWCLFIRHALFSCCWDKSCDKATVHVMFLRCRTILIASRQGQRLRCAMRGMRGGLCSQGLQLTPESRAHCVAARGEQRHFHWRNFGFLSIRSAASPALCLCACVQWGSTEQHRHFPENKRRRYK